MQTHGLRIPVDDDCHRAGRREWIGLALIALACAAYSVDLTVLYLAVPAVSAALHPTAAQLLWILDIYGFVLAGTLLTMGTLGDRIGRRRLLLLGAAGFGIASVLAAFATSAPMLIAARAVLGIAAATLAPTTLSLIRHMFQDARERALAISAWAGSLSAGAALGPVVSGLVLEYFWWGSVFLIAIPAIVLLLALGPFFLPEYRNRERHRIDWLSVALSLAAILPTIYGLKQMAERGLGWPPAITCLAGIGLAVIFFHRQRRLPTPLLDARLLRVRGSGSALAAYALVNLVCSGLSVLIAQYVRLVLQMRPLEAGLWVSPLPAFFMLGSVATPFLLRHAAPVALLISGLVLGATGFLALSQVGELSSPLALVWAGAIYGPALGMVLTVAMERIIACTPAQNSGMVSAVAQMGAQLGAALGIALLGSLSATIYRLDLLKAFPTELPRGVTATLGEALEISGRMAGTYGSSLAHASRAAFIHGMRDAAIWSAIALAAAALVVWRSEPPNSMHRMRSNPP
jgi:MFS transporter, DHA2 family, multidrug resistance protein